MKKLDLKEVYRGVLSLALLKELRSDPVIAALEEYLGGLGKVTLEESIEAYSDFASEVYSAGGVLDIHVRTVTAECENRVIKWVGQRKEIPEWAEETLRHELEVISDITSLDSDILTKPLEYDGFLPKYTTSRTDMPLYYEYIRQNVSKVGYGIYAKSRMFYLDAENTIVPVKNPDPTLLSSLVDYERERELLIANTRALLDGKPAANALLTGDAGTGKSSTVKAIVNELYKDGLRIIEVRKDQLYALPSLLDELAENPLKFILFIDDISFANDDDNFNALKAVLEGSVSAKSKNVVIYATSNRRHIVKERFSDRDVDDIHRNDTMQETISLSERFGLHVTFSKPDKKTYLHIVKHLAEEYGVLDMLAEEEMELLAERFALERGGRSARLARQFVDSLVAKK